MPIFIFAVTETRMVEAEYWVEAASVPEAREKAEGGDTMAEIEWGVSGVTNRHVFEQLAVLDAPPPALPEGRTPPAV